ncbi:MerR family transcriptional regulator [Geodermatophilus sp. DSM 44513]|uniref:MerR family transcriptional regulator n=1 Tax=Geodermatophilus sp. DSM 44513 TaxID=1528104 RepID=UPI0028F70F18|nr:MerR family transcriptional regulator [Geodermatophilus sp. DSM 44513]WNV77006.1 MerR family transcriptional regulator [Geodermatophilus sp. DSM 44513]
MEQLSVGEVAARLGVSSSAVRMWGTRYGLVASARSVGGHRRYTPEDVALLQAVHEAVLSGTDPAAAAAAVRGIADVEGAGGGPRRRAGAGGTGLAVPGAGKAARGLARAAARLDEMRAEDAVLAALRDTGTLVAWDDVVRPVLIAAGAHWAATGTGIEIEHLLSQAVTTALVRHAATLPEPPSERPVLLAGGPQEEHVLPLHAARAALAEDGVPCRLLGPRTPVPALASAARRTRAAAVLVWLSRPDQAAVEGLPELAAAHRRVRVLAGGPGWDGADTGAAAVPRDLAEAVEGLGQAWRRTQPGRRINPTR